MPTEGQAWTRKPFRLTREGDRFFGRGTTDMKGYLAAMLALADRAAKADLKEPPKLSISYDEEIGCVGIRQMIGNLAATIGLPARLYCRRANRDEGGHRPDEKDRLARDLSR